MEDVNFVLLIAGFFVGYLVKGLFTFRAGWSATAILVEKVSAQSLKLLGSTVYNVSFMQQTCKKAIEVNGSENAKIYENELSYDFDKWKKETMQVFVENYPQEYRWQLEQTDWQTAMNSLTDIYKKEKLKGNGESR